MNWKTLFKTGGTKRKSRKNKSRKVKRGGTFTRR
jgi:hypothetical protein